MFPDDFTSWPVIRNSNYMSIIKSLHQSTANFYFPQLCLQIFCLWIFCSLSLQRALLQTLQFFFLVFLTPHHIFVRPKDRGSDDSQEHAKHVERHWGPQQAVQVDHIPAAADPGELIVLSVVLCAGGGEQLWGGMSQFFLIIIIMNHKACVVHVKGGKHRIHHTGLHFH